MRNYHCQGISFSIYKITEVQEENKMEYSIKTSIFLGAKYRIRIFGKKKVDREVFFLL